ncbi:LytR/AlgR family response regulator transcription factor [Chondrinema litorale]|uniref:LytR/AlgR family response regulator transcription factor n=1 Tax=Chondrinema litorale TaxID=2994555 RepID=UPI0025438379|nr:LytTR family DNA-binding domain-containing protein [Chondrinema litorale]UZR94425.1 LytTR family DNA-binding domain-containing protein [Chondrinema litorale]
MRCIVVDDEDVARMVIKDFVERTEGLELVADIDNAIDAYNLLKKEKIDLVFLDIEMPQMTGIELVESLEHKPQFVLVTGRNDYAVKAYELTITDYLIKPVEYKRFLQAVQKVENNFSKDVLDTQGKEDIYVKADSKIVRIKLNDIKFVEALSDYVIIHTGQKKFIVHSTMKGIASRLPDSEFSRVHRSFIVNINQIETIEDMSNIIMPNKIIPIGASYKTSFFKKLNFL